MDTVFLAPNWHHDEEGFFFYSLLAQPTSYSWFRVDNNDMFSYNLKLDTKVLTKGNYSMAKHALEIHFPLLMVIRESVRETF